MKRILIALIRSYQVFLSPIFPSSCRFVPTCSEYAIEAMERHGAFKGSYLVFRRLLR
ncbi:MAG: membrane protein insertion efficiency factor YidD, partial [Desulfomonilaceae bacterium]